MNIRKEIMKDTCSLVGQSIIMTIIEVEKIIYFHTGIKMRALAEFWHIQGKCIQRALNRQHGTDIEYGNIS